MTPCKGMRTDRSVGMQLQPVLWHLAAVLLLNGLSAVPTLISVAMLLLPNQQYPYLPSQQTPYLPNQQFSYLPKEHSHNSPIAVPIPPQSAIPIPSQSAVPLTLQSAVPKPPSQTKQAKVLTGAKRKSTSPCLLAIPAVDRKAGLSNRHLNSNRGICLR